VSTTSLKQFYQFHVTGKVVLYQQHQRNSVFAFDFEFVLIFEFKIDATISMAMTMIPKLSDSEPIWYQTHLQLNLSDIKTPNLSGTEPI
jgi:hypothetical protein